MGTFARQRQLQRELDAERMNMVEQRIEREQPRVEKPVVHKRDTSQERVAAASAIIIGNDLSNPDPVSNSLATSDLFLKI